MFGYLGRTVILRCLTIGYTPTKTSLMSFGLHIHGLNATPPLFGQAVPIGDHDEDGSSTSLTPGPFWNSGVTTVGLRETSFGLLPKGLRTSA